MADFTFRFRVRFGIRRIAFTAERTLVEAPDLPGPIEIHTHPAEDASDQAADLVFRTSGFPDEQSASQAGARVQADLRRTLARLQIGGDFGEAGPKSMFFKAGLQMLEQDGGPRVLNDAPGLIVFETLPTRFASPPTAKVTVTHTPERFEVVFRETRSRSKALTRKEQLAFELYGASFFQKEPRARFMLLFIALEALIEVAARSNSVQSLVDTFLTTLHRDMTISDEERRSFEGGLNRLRDESIAFAAHRYIRGCLGERIYMGKPATEFVRHCNRLRGGMVHGKLAGLREIDATAASLEVFVSDILAFDLLDINI